MVTIKIPRNFAEHCQGIAKRGKPPQNITKLRGTPQSARTSQNAANRHRTVQNSKDLRRALSRHCRTRQTATKIVNLREILQSTAKFMRSCICITATILPEAAPPDAECFSFLCAAYCNFHF